ncbi:N-acetyltransferase GCN5 [Halocalculus aciditolerans]|uniref:N-acetyltransferase GCN5 n=2 Tax=Halocalculus aciditolerans TaxID=1383812 RepID=A0A830FLK4_9EURY|nr:N-acetyltransferase GCN5 [Halocalculus aciditolerans]
MVFTVDSFSAAMDVDFRPLTARDAGDAAALSTAVGWGMRRTDWERFVSLPAVRTVGGWRDGELVATATAVCYDAAVAWIGSIVVAAPYRRRGLGTRVFERAFDDVRDRVDVVGLDANDTGKPIYADAGFDDVLTATVYTGTPSADLDASGVEPLTDAARIAGYDATRVSVDREFLLASLLDDPDTRGVVTTDDTGYAIATPTRTGWAVGPLLADDRQTTHRLLAAVRDALDGDSFTINALGSAPAAAFAAAGLTDTRTLTRMTYPTPEPALTGRGVYANAGFALG